MSNTGLKSRLTRQWNASARKSVSPANGNNLVVPEKSGFGNYKGKLVGMSRFELATSPTPILVLTQSE
ncbi:hypothetical protein HDF11_004752 [Tunturiibacter psychrotolerans]